MPVTISGSGTMSQMTQGGIPGSPTIVAGTAVTCAGQTSIDFTGIPSWARRVTVMLRGVSTSGTSPLQFQLGDAGGIETTGYVSNALTTSTSAAVNTANITSGFGGGSVGSSSNLFNGSIVISTLGSNEFVCQGSISNTGDSRFMSISGGKTLSDTLTQLRITTINGTDTFDTTPSAGSINIFYE